MPGSIYANVGNLLWALFLVGVLTRALESYMKSWSYLKAVLVSFIVVIVIAVCITYFTIGVLLQNTFIAALVFWFIVDLIRGWMKGLF